MEGCLSQNYLELEISRTNKPKYTKLDLPRNTDDGCSDDTERGRICFSIKLHFLSKLIFISRLMLCSSLVMHVACFKSCFLFFLGVKNRIIPVKRARSPVKCSCLNGKIFIVQNFSGKFYQNMCFRDNICTNHLNPDLNV